MPESQPAAPKTRPAPAPAPKKAGTVTVGCKIPTGILLQLQRKETWIEETPTGGRDRIRWTKYGRIYPVRGPAQPNGQVPRGYVRPIVAHSFALTPGIPAEFWDQWLQQNHDTDLVQGGFIFAHSRRDDVVDEAKEKRKLLTGLEPINPGNDPREPKSMNANVGHIETADEFGGEFAPADE